MKNKQGIPILGPNKQANGRKEHQHLYEVDYRDEVDEDVAGLVNQVKIVVCKYCGHTMDYAEAQYKQLTISST